MRRQMLEEECPQAAGGGGEASDEDATPHSASASSVAASSRTSSLLPAMSKSLGRLDRSALLASMPLSAPLKPPAEETLAEVEAEDGRAGD